MSREVDTITDNRTRLMLIARNSDVVRERLTGLISNIAPILGETVTVDTVTPDYESMSEDDLITYLERGSSAIRLWVEDFSNRIEPQLSQPATKLMLKGILRMIG